MSIDLPDVGETNWGDKLNTAINSMEDRLDAAIAAINALAAVDSNSTSTDEQVTSVPFVATGTGITPGIPLGITFVAPASGMVFITLNAYVVQDINEEVTFCSYTLRTGNVIGSGTTVGTAANSDRALVAGRAVNTDAEALMQGSLRTLHTGLTPGTNYNVRVEMAVTGGTGHVMRRQLLIEPVAAHVT